jgi:predicted RNase H-like nuclease (RuvC/YqgF family)
MDSIDKQLADLQQQIIPHLKQTIIERERQIEQLITNLRKHESKEAGIDATTNSLTQERELVIRLNDRIGTQESHIKSLTEENESLRGINLRLQMGKPTLAEFPDKSPVV